MGSCISIQFHLLAGTQEGDVEIPIIFISGAGDIPMSVRAVKAGALEFLTKPFDNDDLLDAIRQALDYDRRNRQKQLAISGSRSRHS